VSRGLSGTPSAGVGHSGGKLITLPQPKGWSALVVPFRSGKLHRSTRPQSGCSGVDRGEKRWPRCKEGLMCDPDNNRAAVPHVGCQKPPSSKSLQLGLYVYRQVVSVDRPSDGMVLFVEHHQPQQPGYHVIVRAMGYRRRVRQRSVSLSDQRTLNSTQLVVVCNGKLAPATDALSQLRQGECQKRQRLAATSVPDQPSY
jgi:hypothetical protein